MERSVSIHVSKAKKMVCAPKKEIKLFKHLSHVTARDDSPGLLATDKHFSCLCKQQLQDKEAIFSLATSAEESGFFRAGVGELQALLLFLRLNCPFMYIAA